MPAIDLRKITHDNFEIVIGLGVADGQNIFVSPVVYALAEAYVYAPQLTALAAYDGDEPVGFVMYGHQLSQDRWKVQSLIVDARYQGRGYGRAIMQAVIALMVERHGCNEIFTGYVEGNDIARGLYERLGFRATGEVKDNEVFMALTIADSP
jgi:diamine N-acetyltransferase